MDDEGPPTRLPLLPSAIEDGLLGNLDITDVLRQTTREFLEKKIFHRKNIYSEQALDEYEVKKKELHDVEDAILLTQAKNLVIRDLSWKRKLLETDENIINVPEYYINKYHLLAHTEVKPMHLMALDKTSFSNDMRVKGYFATKELVTRANVCSHYTRFREERIEKLTASKRKKKSLQKNESCLKIEKPTYIQKKSKLELYFETAPKDTIHISPEIVLFTESKTGITYKKKLTFANKSPFALHINLIQPTNFGTFFVTNTYVGTHKADDLDNTLFIAPGLAISLCINYKCRDIATHSDVLRFEVDNLFCKTIPIRAVRPEPCLKSDWYLDLKYAEYRETNTIDCGAVLTGGSRKICFQLHNTGSDAKFYITSDLNWIDKTIQCWTAKKEVKTPPFKIIPAMFQVKRNYQQEIFVEFEPKHDGLFIECYYIVCSNYTMRTLTVMGDSIHFDPLKIYLMNSKFNLNEIDANVVNDPSCKFFIHFGVTCPGRILSVPLTVRNTSEINYLYHWKKRKLITESSFTTYFHLPRDAIKIRKPNNVVFARNDITFIVDISLKNNQIVQPGLYKTKLAFFLDEIPKKCLLKLQDYEQFPIIKNKIDSVSIELFNIEIWLQLEMPYVIISPLYLYIPDRSFQRKSTMVTVSNPHLYDVLLNWLKPTPRNHVIQNVLIRVTPKKSLLRYKKKRKYIITIEPLNEGSYSVNLLLRLRLLETNSTTMKYYHLLIEGEIRPPNLDTTFLIYQMGIRRQKGQGAFKVTFTHPDDKRMPVEARELIFLMPTIGDERYKVGSKQIIDHSIDCHKNRTGYIRYKFNTEKDEIYTSILELKRNNRTAYAAILYDVQSSLLLLNYPVCEIRKPMFIGEILQSKIQLTNCSSIEGIFIFVDETQGKDKDKLKVIKKPTQGEITAQSSGLILLYIYPLIKGKFEDFKIPIFIPDRNEHIYFNLKGEIKEVMVHFSWNASKSCDVIWPIDAGPRHYHKGNYCCVCLPTSLEEKADGEEIRSVDYEEKLLTFKDSTISLYPYSDWPLVPGKYYYDRREGDELSLLEFDTTWPCESYMDQIDVTQDKQRVIDWFNEEAIIFEIEAREIATRFVTLHNLTPLFIRVKVLIEIYGEKMVDISDLKCGLNETNNKYIEMLWEKNIQAGNNLVLSINDELPEIQGFETIDIQITAFSNLWGIYTDRLIINLPQIPAFILPIIVIVKQNPIYFTFAPNDINPKLRFPSVLPKQVYSQNVYVRNTCPKVLKVAWIAYGPPHTKLHAADLVIPEKWDPFTVHVELECVNDEHFCKIRMLEYFGHAETKIFSVEPKNMYLEPNTQQKMTITFNPRSWMLPIGKLKAIFNGTVRGIIYLMEPQDKVPDTPTLGCFRSDGFGIDVFKLTLKAQVQISKIEIINAENNDFHFEVHIGDILAREQFGYREMRSFILKNAGDSTAFIVFHMEPPFFVVKLSHINAKQIHFSAFPEVELRQEESVELFYELRLRMDDIPKELIVSKWDPNTTLYNIDDAQPDFKEFKLQIIQKGYVEQSIGLYVKLIQPKIELTEDRIVFGPVFIGHTLYFSLGTTSKYRDEFVSFNIVSNVDNAFDINPRSNLLRYLNRFDFIVTFCPREAGDYIGRLELKTCFSEYTKIIILEGVGVWNYKYNVH